jgi:hypothetical protein
MSNPTPEQLDEVFTALVTNGFDFLVRSAHELAKDQKFSIAHFATGLELLLKGRLFHEHWTLIATDPHGCAWTGVKDGTAHTIQASDLCAAITTTTGTSLNHEQGAFESVFKHRNRVLHWAPNGNLATTVAEQCLAWHFVRALLLGSWKGAFSSFDKRIDEVELLLRPHRQYLQVRYDQHQKKLSGMESAGRVLQCATCRFRAGVADQGSRRIVAFECLVCSYKAVAARVACGALYVLDQLPVECDCGSVHDRAELLEAMNPTPIMRQKDLLTYEPDLGSCGECLDLEESVAPDGDGYSCVACGAIYAAKDAESCGCCSRRWFGWDSESSSFTGCEHCEGQEVGDD